MLKQFYEFKKNRYKKYIKNKWPLIQKKGRTRFTLIKSIIYAIFWSIIFQIALRKFSIIANISGLTVGFMAGLLFADGEWAKNEKEYLKLINKTPV
jgi:membrane associated rhomboid family serine protease